VSFRDRVSPSAGIGLALSLAVLVFAIATVVRWTGPAVALSYRWVAGDEIRNRLTMDMTVATQPAVLEEDVQLRTEATTVARVLDVDQAGNATLEITTEDVQVVDSNVPVPQEQFEKAVEQPHTVTLSPEGRILESSFPWLGPQGVDQKGFNQGPLLPDHPVGPGDEWEVDYVQEMGFGEGGLDLHATNRFIRYDEVEGIETVVIDSEVSGPIDFTIDPSDIPAGAIPEDDPLQPQNPAAGPTLHYTGELTADARSWLDPLTGDMLRNEMQATVTISYSVPGLPQFGTDMEIELESERVFSD
jgi:hypothetical protein